MQTQLSGNNLGDVHGGLFSNNVNSISFNVHSHVWKLRRQGIFEDFATRLGRWSRNHRERTVEWDDISFLDASEVTIGDDYRIFAAVYQGIAVLVKVYEGPDSRQRIKTDLSINHSFQHPNLLRVVAACKTAQIPFIVFKTPIHSLPPEIGVFRSLTCYLAAALGDGDQECLVRAVQFMRDVSSGFSHLENMWKVKRFALSRTTFDLLVDANNNVCVSVGLIKDQEAAQRTLANEWLNVFEDLCARNLREANEECHSDFRRRLPVSAPSTDVATTLAPLPSAIEAATTPLLNLNQTGSLIQTKPLFSPQPPSVPEYPPRREYAFVPQTGSDRPSLKEINKDFARFMRNLQVGPTISSNIERLRRNLRLPTTVQHRCPGYKRQELAIATSVSRTAIISHFTPLIKEICQVCNQEVKEGIFLCPCGQADDGVASTVRCHKCLVWSHRGCHQVLIIDSLQFTCPECQQNSIGLNPAFASSSPSRPVDPSAVGPSTGSRPQPRSFRSSSEGTHIPRQRSQSFMSIFETPGMERGKSNQTLRPDAQAQADFVAAHSSSSRLSLPDGPPKLKRAQNVSAHHAIVREIVAEEEHAFLTRLTEEEEEEEARMAVRTKSWLTSWMFNSSRRTPPDNSAILPTSSARQPAFVSSPEIAASQLHPAETSPKE